MVYLKIHASSADRIAVRVTQINLQGVRLVTGICFCGNKSVFELTPAQKVLIQNQGPTNVNTASLHARPAWIRPLTAPVAQDFYISMVISAFPIVQWGRMGKITSKFQALFTSLHSLRKYRALPTDCHHYC